jgi:hypothetical protein
VNDDLLNTAFELAIKAYGPACHAEAKERLRQRFPQSHFDAITEAYRSACHLHELAYDAADKLRDGIHSKSDALALLRQRCPGFPERTYKRAFARGLFESR